jgi:hypothetical protein
LFWDSTKFPSRKYRIIARIVHSDGVVAETLPIELRVDNSPSAPAVSLPVSIEASSSVEDVLAKAVAPSSCGSPRECAIYCKSSAERRGLCAKYIESAEILPAPNTQASTTTLSVSAASSTFIVASSTGVPFFNKFVEERIGARAFLDQDSDGIADFDELYLYGTELTKYDSDGDGVPDGAELMARTNPLGHLAIGTGKAVGEGIKMEDPRNVDAWVDTRLSVNAVEVAATTTSAENQLRASKIVFKGYGLPNSFLTLFIYSDPIVVTVKTDATGVWSYTLDRELPDGAHEIIVAMVDAGGKIIARGAPLPFVKQAAAISIGAEPMVPSERTTAPGFFTGTAFLAFLAILLGVIGVGISVVGLTVSYRHPEMPLRHS